MNEVPGSFEPDLELWDPWTPAEVAAKLEGVEATWYALAGWALDLFQGRQTREHEDLEIESPRTSSAPSGRRWPVSSCSSSVTVERGR